MKRYLSAGLMLGMVIAAAACDDEFLTTEPEDVIPSEDYWQTERDFTAAVNAVYRDIDFDSDQAYFDGATDLGYSQKDWTRVHAYAQGHQNATTGWAGDVWENMYRGVGRANEILTQLDSTDVLSDDVASEIEAQAHFLRGYFYNQLLWMFGGVPLYDHVPTVEEAREVERPSRDEVIDFVLADLTAATEGLPISWPASEDGRATLGAALAYRARAALYEASYQKYHAGNASGANELFQMAAEAAQAVIDLGVYELHPDFRELFMYAGEGSSEVIFDYQRITGVNGWDAWVWFAPHSMGADIDLEPTRTLVDKFHMADGLPINESPMYNPSPPVIEDGETASLGMYADRDPRFYGTVLFPGAEFNETIYNSFPDSPTADRLANNVFSNTHTGYAALKYVDPQDESNPTESGINAILMRYADVLLMLAEAKVELNQIDASVEAALNEIRDRVGMPHVTLGSQQEMIELIRNERAVELAFEGHRLADIRRWKIAEHVMPGTVPGIDVRQGGEIVTLRGLWQRAFSAEKDYLWPIPVSELDLNPKLEQNPGY